MTPKAARRSKPAAKPRVAPPAKKTSRPKTPASPARHVAPARAAPPSRAASRPAPESAADPAFQVADSGKLAGEWEVYGERLRRYEVHFNGPKIELIRGPISLSGYGVRVFHRNDGRTSAGFQGSTDLSPTGIAAVLADAERVSRYSDFPAKRIDLPSQGSSGRDGVEVVDARLWENPVESLSAYVQSLFSAFEGRREVLPSFGSVRATLSEVSLANSVGLRASYPHTSVELEVAVKSFGGAEGAPPGEYWVNELARRLVPDELAPKVEQWCRFAVDGRRASPPPTGDIPVLLPPAVLAGIMPPVLSMRESGAARLREIAPAIGSTLAAESVTIHDDGRFPWGPSTAPVDDEGTRQGRTTLIDQGVVRALIYDSMHAGAFDVASTGNGLRGVGIGPRDWHRFTHAPGTGATTVVIEPGGGGTDAELMEAAGDGIWVQQLGWAIPDPLSAAFGGEIRIGYLVRHGKIVGPVRGGTVGGFALAAPGSPSLLTGVMALGSSATLADTLSSPTLLVNTLTVAGG